MRKTTFNSITDDEQKNKILVETEGLQRLTSSGRTTAISIGNAAGAKVRVGRRVLWNVEKVKEYLNKISE